MDSQVAPNEIDALSMIRDHISDLVQDIMAELETSEEQIELPITIELTSGLTIEKQKAKDIAKTVKRGLLEKQLLIAVNQEPRNQPIEVGYIQPPNSGGKFISAIISPDYQQKLTDPSSALKQAIVQMHALDLTSAALGIRLVSHGISIDRMVYSVNLGS